MLPTFAKQGPLQSPDNLVSDFIHIVRLDSLFGCWFYFAATTLQCQPYVHAIEGWGGPILEIQSYPAKVYLVSIETRGVFHTQIK